MDTTKKELVDELEKRRVAEKEERERRGEKSRRACLIDFLEKSVESLKQLTSKTKEELESLLSDQEERRRRKEEERKRKEEEEIQSNIKNHQVFFL